MHTRLTQNTIPAHPCAQLHPLMYVLFVRVFILNYPSTLINKRLKSPKWKSKYMTLYLYTYKTKNCVSLTYVIIFMSEELWAPRNFVQ